MSQVPSLPPQDAPAPPWSVLAARPEAARAAAEVPTALAVGSLAGLVLLKATMLAALFTRTDPYPPLRFAPLFGASLALAALAVALIRARSRWFVAPVVPVLLVALLSVGPQKLYPGESDFFAQTPAVYPVIVVGSSLIVALALSSRALYRAFSPEVAS